MSSTAFAVHSTETTNHQIDSSLHLNRKSLVKTSIQKRIFFFDFLIFLARTTSNVAQNSTNLCSEPIQINQAQLRSGQYVWFILRRKFKIYFLIS